MQRVVQNEAAPEQASPTLSSFAGQQQHTASTNTPPASAMQAVSSALVLT